MKKIRNFKSYGNMIFSPKNILLLNLIAAPFDSKSEEINIPLQSYENNSEECAQKLLMNGKKEVTYEIEHTEESAKAFSSIPRAQASGIVSIKRNGERLVLQTISYDNFPEVRGQVTKSYKVIDNEAKPISTAILTTITLGIPLLTNPSKTLRSLVGCTDKILDKKTLRESTIENTGNSKWEKSFKSHKIKLTIMGRETLLDTQRPTFSQGEMEAELDLKGLLLNSETITNNNEVVIKCLTCSIDNVEYITSEVVGNLTLSNSSDSVDYAAIQKQYFDERREQEQREALAAKKLELERKKHEEKLKQAERAQLERKRKEEQQRTERLKKNQQKEKIFSL